VGSPEVPVGGALTAAHGGLYTRPRPAASRLREPRAPTAQSVAEDRSHRGDRTQSRGHPDGARLDRPTRLPGLTAGPPGPVPPGGGWTAP